MTIHSFRLPLLALYFQLQVQVQFSHALILKVQTLNLLSPNSMKRPIGRYPPLFTVSLFLRLLLEAVAIYTLQHEYFEVEYEQISLITQKQPLLYTLMDKIRSTFCIQA